MVAAAQPEDLFPESPTEEPVHGCRDSDRDPWRVADQRAVEEPVAVAAEAAPEPTPVLPPVEDSLPVDPTPSPRKKGKAAPAAEQLSLF